MKNSKEFFLEQARAAREERALEKKKEAAIVLIQSHVRGYLARNNYYKQIISDFDQLFCNDLDKPCLQVFHVADRFLSLMKVDLSEHRDRLEKLCRYLVNTSETSDSTKVSYIAVALNKEFSLVWINHIKRMLYKCCLCIEKLKPECHSESLSLALYLRTLVAFTSPNTWLLLKNNKQLAGLKPGMHQMCSNIMGWLVQRGFFTSLKTVLLRGICRNNVSLKPIAFTAILTLTTRPLISANFSENLLTMFLVNVFTVPGLVYQIEAITPDFITTTLIQNEVLQKAVKLLSDENSMKVVINSVQGTSLLSLLANLIHLFHLESTTTATELGFPDFTVSFVN